MDMMTCERLIAHLKRF